MAGDRRSYDIATSTEAQGNLQGIVARLETLINDRDAAVKAAMADFQADGVSDQYHDKEVQWNRAAAEVRTIISLVRTTLQRNDETAHSTLARAKSAVDGI
ncbi:pore-forming ESAT-6 family protein [Krasilnikovia sp. MM14-A1259]|uniref:pore-forming ESAT-6 family protein n=1 Tax=Krasilnikovia sp. MM14-A1259 TaxID=3373539 RepID=UPI00381AD159